MGFLRRNRYILLGLLCCVLLIILNFYLLIEDVLSNEGVENQISLESAKAKDDKDAKGWDKYEVLDIETVDSKLDHYTLDKDTLNILLLGIDSRDNNLIGRSDSIMLVSLNKNKSSINLLSIPRDSYVNIPGHGYSKINHSYAYGGADLTKETVENLLGVQITNTVCINFNSFESVIDILGGVEVEVPFDFTEQNTTREWLEFKKGKMTLNGEESLAYARMRHQDPEGDFGRGKRQQQIIESLIYELSDIKNVFKLKKIYSEVKNNVSTDLSVGEVLGLASYSDKLNNIEKNQILGEPKMIDGVSYIQLEKDSLEMEKLKLLNFLDIGDSSMDNSEVNDSE